MKNHEINAPVIMVIDDDTISRTLIRLLLVRNGYQVQEATGGREALNVLVQEPPDLLIIDNIMRDITGITLCQRIRSLYTAEELPIILISARMSPREIRKGLEMGANQYLKKPIFAHELAECISGLLE